jgi:tripartite-type tricarboxylate transporter receptor subunit TctC
MSSKLSKFISTAVFGALLGTAGIAHAADFPQHRVNLVVWAGAGGALDTYGRELSKLLDEQAGWQTKVVNRPGGSGSVGMSYVLNQPADGYNILVHTSTLTFSIARNLMPYKLDDLRFVRAMQGEPSALAVRKNADLHSARDFVDAMKKDPEGLRVGGYGTGGFHQYMLYQFMNAEDFKAGWIPYDASGKVALALMGDHLDAAMMTPSSGLSQVESGDIRLLGISTDERSRYFPDVPTFKEQGIDLEGMVWRGVSVKAGTPDDVVASIQAALDKVQASDEWKTFMTQQKQDDIAIKDDDFTAMAEKQLKTQSAFLKEVGFQ